ncbi:FAD-binding domain-containing protein [Mycena capillaripes]|nr:FAD-binding domain-containing protein [Mycena capillaripes]
MFTLAPKSTLLLFLAAALANSVQAATLASCLADSGLNFEDSQNPNWQNSTTPYNTRFHYNPSARVYPIQTIDVSKAIQCAQKYGVHVSALSGGHSYSASGFGSRNGTLVIDFRDMTQVGDYSPSDETVTVQPGIHLGDMALELYDKYGRAVAHGQCPYVGLGGHACNGGWGLGSRSWGLVIDQTIGAELVFANGTIARVSQTENSEIFWAIRGGGSAFGIVTQFTLKTHKAPDTVVRFAFNFLDLDRSPDRFARVLSAYQDWSRAAPKEMGIVANVWQGGKDIEMAGYYMGSRKDFDGTTASLLNATGEPSATYVQERGWIPALMEAAGGTNLSTKGTPDIHDTFYAKSLVVSKDSPLTSDSFVALAKYFTTASVPNTFSWFIQFELWGGGDSVISSVHANATAYPHRNHHWTCQFYGRTTGPWFPQGTAYVNGLVNSITNSMQGTRFGAYANYLDPELDGWRGKYYAGNYARLAKIQEDVDPYQLFMKPQNIGAPDL